uniref:Uncharacterized protein n=1 Tax=Steinernema glaseri TaxID=37863 RepID=A0A1I7Z6H7_9BILA
MEARFEPLTLHAINTTRPKRLSDQHLGVAPPQCGFLLLLEPIVSQLTGRSREWHGTRDLSRFITLGQGVWFLLALHVRDQSKCLVQRGQPNADVSTCKADCSASPRLSP